MLKNIILFLSLALILGSCGKFHKVMQSDDVELKYEASQKYYEEENYYKAGLLIEDIQAAFIGTERAEKLQFQYANTQYEQQQYLMSNHYFKTFYNTYNRSPYAEQALFLSAYSLYKDTPRYNLDQSNTTKAISEMQDFMNRYPESEYIDEANEVIVKLRQRLEKKGFESAMEYYTLRRYKAAAVALDNFTKDYPDSKYKQQALYHKLESEYELAKISYFSKQEERYEAALTTYEKFVERYPSSEYKREADKIATMSRNELNRVKSLMTSSSKEAKKLKEKEEKAEEEE
ncbi:outer membrane protein assembly factor BamD [Algivirga pacifica]|uniref:Outer membrane protein assembly factor BamD n=1 Tax=Algivirga pacifica TaxID=1162670 RepID=A0ABP9CXB8_9BACT